MYESLIKTYIYTPGGCYMSSLFIRKIEYHNLLDRFIKTSTTRRRVGAILRKKDTTFV